MATGTSRRALGLLSSAGLALALVAGSVVALAGCGSGQAGAFAWLHPQNPPADWTVVRIPSGAELAYPPSWRRQHGDPGTATAALIAPGGAYVGYLNLTPRQADETLSNWASFRIRHNIEEGERDVTRLATANGLRFLTGHGSCVMDAYTTVTGARYTEIACLVVGSHAESVIVGAAPPGHWRKVSGVVERAIAGVRT